MDFWTSIGVLAMTLVLLGVGVAIGGLLVVSFSRNRWLGSLTYLMDRLKKLECDQRRSDEDLQVLRARLKQGGLLDEEDLADLRRELNELPRQRKAERLELLEAARKHGLGERMVSDTPETLQ